MAGGFGGLTDPKKQSIKSNFNSEVLRDFQEPSPPKKITLGGILGLNQTVEFNKETKKVQSWGQELLSGVNHLAAEEKLLFDNRQKELEKNVAELRSEIAQLLKATDILNQEVEKVAIDPIIEASEYQIGYLGRIKNFIANFRKNISEASLWLDSFTAKKKKRNMFWNNVKNKKNGGEQYLFSNEHSAARSGT